ncbi:nitric oxide-associated protein 1-like isoform X2 [Liolophura sinensis]|uniref:nitric oxide-associated protein 1-like isoform X2 n=1 Tax=Liolophura sinensis TaxID=3198878 RepID=UPI0031588957
MEVQTQVFPSVKYLVLDAVLLFTVKTLPSPGDVFLLGSTNSGKSTLFNALLSSDYCKYHVRDVIHRATVSRWPGTTIDLLKFPIIAPTRERLYLRTQRLIKEKKEKWKKERELINTSKNPNIVRNAPLTGTIGQTNFKEQPVEEENENDGEELNYQCLIVPPSYTFTTEGDVSVGSLSRQDLYTVTAAERKARELVEDDLERLTNSRWLFDTPGLVSSDQVINRLTPEELSIVLPATRLQPRSYVLKPGQVMFVSGLSRIDYAQGLKSIYLTVLAAKRVPVHVIDPNTEDPDQFYNQALGTKQLGVPLRNADGLMSIPSLIGQEYEVTGQGWKESAADVILSSIGFVSVTVGQGLTVVLRAYTPGGQGCRIHSPSLLPKAVNLRGKREKGTAKYRIRRK